MGLVISALASNADKAMSVVPLLLMPQIMLAGVMVAFPEMNLPTRLASYLVVSRWANQAQEIGLLQGRQVDAGFLRDEAYSRSRWNLYPDYNLKENTIRFQQERGPRIDRAGLLTVDVIILAVFVSAQLGAVAWILRRQDAW